MKASLDRGIERGVIAPVPIETPVTWCSPMVVVLKADGIPCRIISCQKLNAECLQETHHTAPLFQLASKIPPHMKKTVIDIVDCYHLVALDPESQPLTTFITGWDRYRYLRMPRRFVATGDAYTHRYDAIYEGVKIVDDALLYDASIKDYFFYVWDYLTLCANNGVAINAPKFQLYEGTVEFAGVTTTTNSIISSAKMLSAISDFPNLTDLTSQRFWFGLINQVGWVYSVSSVIQSFRDLIRSNQKF